MMAPSTDVRVPFQVIDVTPEEDKLIKKCLAGEFNLINFKFNYNNANLTTNKKGAYKIFRTMKIVY